jgi:hypothetical protein
MSKIWSAFWICRPYGPIFKALEYPWKATRTQLFGKLKTLKYYTCGTDPSLPRIILPSMEQLTIVNLNFPIHILTKLAPTFYAPRISTFVPILHTLHFLGVRIDPRSLEQLIRSAWLTNLRHFRVGHCPSISRDTWNMPPLIRSMEVAIPRLKTFEWWTYSQVPTLLIPFDTFTRLRKLKNLSIAFHTLVRRGTFSPLGVSRVMYPEALLPKALESLTIHKTPVEFFEIIILFIRQYLWRAENGWSALTGLIKYIAAMSRR